MTRAGLTLSEYLCALLVVVIWGLNFVVMKFGVQGLSPMLLGALRFSMASLPLLLFIKPPKVPARFVVIYGLTQGLGQFGLMFTAINVGMPAGMASLVLQTQAFFTMILAGVLLHERPHACQWVGLAIAAVGLGCIATSAGGRPGDMTLLGFLLTVGAALMWSLSNVVIRFTGRAAPVYDSFSLIVWSSLVPIVPFFLLAFWLEGTEHTMAALSNAGWKEFAAVAYLACLATLTAYSLWARLLKRHPTSRIAPFSLLVPVVGLITAAIVFDERLGPAQWLGTMAVLGGLLVSQFGQRWWPKRAVASQGP